MHDDQYDLLTAALIGVAIGVGATLLFRRGPSGARPLGMAVRAAGRGARWAGDAAGLAARHSPAARWLRERGEQFEGLGEQVQDYLASARARIDETVDDEIRDLRKALRRQKKRLGL